jgi:SNF2 family DNA or RNA helicase
MIDQFAHHGKWGYVVLDEGHLIKNPATKTTKAMHTLVSQHRLIATGNLR